MCKDCLEEYNDSNNRRFHAQPNACPSCGPKLELLDEKGNVVYSKEQALEKTIEKIIEGKIIALKGLGGYQLLVDARNFDAVQSLRARKNRAEKPFALMFPSLKLSINISCLAITVL